MSKQRKHANAIYRMQQTVPERHTTRTNALVRIRRECIAHIWAKSESERFWAAAFDNLVEILAPREKAQEMVAIMKQHRTSLQKLDDDIYSITNRLLSRIGEQKSVTFEKSVAAHGNKQRQVALFQHMQHLQRLEQDVLLLVNEV